MLFDLAGSISSCPLSDIFATINSDLQKPFAIRCWWELGDIYLGMHHCPEKNLYLYQLPGLKLLNMPWEAPMPPISGKIYNWRLNFSLECKLKQVTTCLIWAWKACKDYCISNLCVTCMWFVSLGSTFIPSYILLRYLGSMIRFSGILEP